MRQLVIGLAFSIGAFSPANAEVTYKKFDQHRNEPTYRSYITGLGNGLSWANTVVSLRGLGGLYCPPEGFGNYTDQFIDLLDRQVQNNEADGLSSRDDPVEFLLMKALSKAFPCKPED